MSALGRAIRANMVILVSASTLTPRPQGIDEVCEPGLKKRSMALAERYAAQPVLHNDQADAESGGWRAGREHFAHGRRPEPAGHDYG